jgi:hypothetical protein
VTRALLAAGAVALVLGALPVHAAATASCSTKSLAAAGGYHVTRLQAVHGSCAKARSVARTVASQLGKSGTVNIPGVAGFALSTQTCTSCGTTTQVTLSWPSGMKVVVSLRGGNAGSEPPPAQQAPGSGPPTTI